MTHNAFTRTAVKVLGAVVATGVIGSSAWGWVYIEERELPPLVSKYPTYGYKPPPGSYLEYNVPGVGAVQVVPIKHHNFLNTFALPNPGDPADIHAFGSTVDLFANSVAYSAPAMVTVSIQYDSLEPPSTELYSTEMLQLNISGGTLPVGWMIRESPTLISNGETRVKPSGPGWLVWSWFKIYTELSVDGGLTWIPDTNPTKDIGGNSFCRVDMPEPSSGALAVAMFSMVAAAWIRHARQTRQERRQARP